MRKYTFIAATLLTILIQAHSANALTTPLNCPKAVTVKVYYKTNKISNVTWYNFYHNVMWSAKSGVITKEVQIGTAPSYIGVRTAMALKESITLKTLNLATDIEEGCNRGKLPKNFTRVTIEDNASQLLSRLH